MFLDWHLTHVIAKDAARQDEGAVVGIAWHEGWERSYMALCQINPWILIGQLFMYCTLIPSQRHPLSLSSFFVSWAPTHIASSCHKPPQKSFLEKNPHFICWSNIRAIFSYWMLQHACRKNAWNSTTSYWEYSSPNAIMLKMVAVVIVYWWNQNRNVTAFRRLCLRAIPSHTELLRVVS